MATIDGTVRSAAYTIETGYVIELQHYQGFISVYKHCESLLKQEGETAKAGEAIALVGSTGKWSTGPHLHFELWYKGRAIDPTNYIPF